MIDNSRIMDKRNNAAKGYAEKISRKQRLKRVHCPGVDYAVRHIVNELVNTNLIGADEMYKFLNERRYRDNTPEIWWYD